MFFKIKQKNNIYKYKYSNSIEETTIPLTERTKNNINN